MRTRPRRTSSSRPFRVNVLSGDGLLRQLLAPVERRSTLVFLFSDAPLPPTELDAYVMGVSDLHLLAGGESPGTRPPSVIAWGPPERLRSAFLAGCDDYLKEPWDVEELETRLERALELREERLGEVSSGFELDGRLIRLPDGRAVQLSAQEAVVAALLFSNCGVLVSRRTLSLALWGHERQSSSRAVDMQVSALRRKLGRDLISCVRGRGYLIDLKMPEGSRDSRHRVDELGAQW